MLSLEGIKVTRIYFCVRFRVVPLDESKGVSGKCIESMCQYGWWFLVVHGRNPRMHVCFDKMYHGPMCKIICSPKFIFIVYKWPHSPQNKGEVGYTKQSHEALKPLEATKSNYYSLQMYERINMHISYVWSTQQHPRRVLARCCTNPLISTHWIPIITHGKWSTLKHPTQQNPRQCEPLKLTKKPMYYFHKYRHLVWIQPKCTQWVKDASRTDATFCCGCRCRSRNH